MAKLKKKVGIVGYGYVGKAMAKFFCTHYDTYAHDPFLLTWPQVCCHGKQCYLHTGATRDQINECDVVLVCVPTQENPYTGRCVTTIVEEVVKWVESPLTIIKSTVEPGTTDRLKTETGKRIIFSPEYCGESSYWSPYAWDRDVKETPFFIFGGHPADTSEAVDLYLPITGPVKHYTQTDAKSAEMAKYMENVFYATKIMFCYEMASICSSAGLDYNRVRELWLLDPRINPMHTAVFADNVYPVGGRCLPKDTSALVNYARTLGYDPKLIQGVLDSNDRIAEFRKKLRGEDEGTPDCAGTEHGNHDAGQPDRPAQQKCCGHPDGDVPPEEAG